jgi:hypothetical protein
MYIMLCSQNLISFPGAQVAFSAFTDFGAVMAMAIAVHNIPEVCLCSSCASGHTIELRA